MLNRASIQFARRMWPRYSILSIISLLALPPVLSAQSGPAISTGTPTYGQTGTTLYVTLPITNVGGSTASSLQLTKLTLSTESLLTPSLPVTVGDLAAGASFDLYATFDASSLLPGKNYLLTVRGSYQGASGLTGFSVNRFINTAGNSQYTITTVVNSSPTGTVFDGRGVAVDAAGNLFATGTVPGTGGFGGFPAILEVNGSGVTRVIGSNAPNSPFPGCGDSATAIGMTDLGGVAVDSSENLFVASLGNAPILEVSGGTVNCLINALYFGAVGIVTDNAGNVYFSTGQDSHVYLAPGGGGPVLIAGNGTPACTAGQIGKPVGLALDVLGSLYIADPPCNVIWKTTSTGLVAVAGIPGSPLNGFAGDGGPATSAFLNQPTGVAVDLDGNIYIADTGNARVRKVSADGTINTIAGTGIFGFTGEGGPATSAELDGPSSVAVGPGGKVYVGIAGDIADGGDRIVVLTPVHLLVKGLKVPNDFQGNGRSGALYSGRAGAEHNGVSNGDATFR